MLNQAENPQAVHKTNATHLCHYVPEDNVNHFNLRELTGIFLRMPVLP